MAVKCLNHSKRIKIMTIDKFVLIQKFRKGKVAYIPAVQNIISISETLK